MSCAAAGSNDTRSTPTRRKNCAGLGHEFQGCGCSCFMLESLHDKEPMQFIRLMSGRDTSQTPGCSIMPASGHSGHGDTNLGCLLLTRAIPQPLAPALYRACLPVGQWAVRCCRNRTRTFDIEPKQKYQQLPIISVRLARRNRLVDRTLILPALPFKMHAAQAKGGCAQANGGCAQANGGWMCPAAKLIRRTQSCDVH
jgi:hypothetical protein